MYLRIVWILLISIFIIGCSSNSNITTSYKVKKYPEWILNPTFDGKIAISSYAPFPENKDRKKQKRHAIMNANAIISKNKKVLIYDFCMSNTSINGVRVTQCESELLSEDDTLGVKIINKWIDKETNILYIRAIPKKLIL